MGHLLQELYIIHMYKKLYEIIKSQLCMVFNAKQRTKHAAELLFLRQNVLN